jgi:hypothetical protein
MHGPILRAGTSRPSPSLRKDYAGAIGVEGAEREGNLLLHRAPFEPIMGNASTSRPRTWNPMARSRRTAGFPTAPRHRSRRVGFPHRTLQDTRFRNRPKHHRQRGRFPDELDHRPVWKRGARPRHHLRLLCRSSASEPPWTSQGDSRQTPVPMNEAQGVTPTHCTLSSV